MINAKEEKWLKQLLHDCLKSGEGKVLKEKKLLEGFSFLILQMLNNTERIANETWALWEIEPKAKELKAKFDTLEKSLSYLKKYCQEKIAVNRISDIKRRKGNG